MDFVSFASKMQCNVLVIHCISIKVLAYIVLVDFAYLLGRFHQNIGP